MHASKQNGAQMWKTTNYQKNEGKHAHPLFSKPPERIITYFYFVVSFKVSFFSVCGSSRLEPHLQRYFPFGSVFLTNFAPSHLVDDHAICEVSVSVINV